MDNIILVPLELDKFYEKIRELIADGVAAAGMPDERRNSNSSPERDKPVTTKELCEYLKVTEPTVLRWRKKGKIPFFTIGSAVRFNKDEVVKALSES